MQKKNHIRHIHMTRNKERYAYVYMGGSQQISPKKRKQTRMNQITYTQGLYETINTTTIRIIIMNMRVRKS